MPGFQFMTLRLPDSELKQDGEPLPDTASTITPLVVGLLFIGAARLGLPD
jgi:hypothetical protein